MKRLYLFFGIILLSIVTYSQEQVKNDTLRYKAFELKPFDFSESDEYGEAREVDYSVKLVKDEMLKIGTKLKISLVKKLESNSDNNISTYLGKNKNGTMMVALQPLKFDLFQITLITKGKSGVSFNCKKVD